MHCPKALVPAPMATFARYNKSVAFLRKIDHDWANLVARVGPCRHDPKAAREPYEALVRAIGYQQLTAKAGDAMIGRLKALHPDAAFPSPEHILRSDFDALRACGFSATKIATIKAIADGALSGQVPTRGDAVVMEDEELVERITKIKGIGRWTVEMLLMYSLERMDILPVGDFGVRDGYRKLKNLAELPKPNKLREIGKDWAPHRTVASWYLWRIPRDRDADSKRSAESKQAGPKRR
jgi:DNA-3-methyladenine glycosylase II